MHAISRITPLAVLLTLPALCQAKTTTPVGSTVVDVPAGNTALSIPFIKADLYQGYITGLTEGSQDLTTTMLLSESNWRGGQFNEGDFPKFNAEFQETSQHFTGARLLPTAIILPKAMTGGYYLSSGNRHKTSIY